MDAAQTKKNLRISFFVFTVLFFLVTVAYVTADEVASNVATTFDDPDGDGLSNEEEKVYGTDPNVADTDNDGYSDGVEIKSGYDPLKPAPGDRVTQSETTADQSGTASEGMTENITEKATQKLADLVAEKVEKNNSNDGNNDGSLSEITQQDITQVIGEVMSSGQSDITLPEVNISDLKVKDLPKNLSQSEAEDQNRQDVIEYLTLVSYILVSNLPVQIHNSDDLQSFLTSSGSRILTSLISGNYSFLDSVEESGKKALEEVNKVEVPKSMLDTHAKMLQLLTFASNLKGSIKTTVSPDDPLGQMYMLAKVQGFLLTMGSFMQDAQGKLADFGIKNIPLDI